jgi:hypothetical protein
MPGSPKLYVLDFFAPNKKGCSHGAMVADVVYSVLNAHNAGHLKADVRFIDLGFYHNPAAAIAWLTPFLDSVEPERRVFLKSMLEYYAARKVEADSTEVPLLFLQLAYEYLVQLADTAVITSSF